MTNIFERMAVANETAEIVSGQDAYAPLKNLIAQSEAFDAHKQDYVLTPASLTASGYDVVINGQAFRPNKNGMKQLAVKLSNVTNDEESEGQLPAFWMMKGNGAKAHECEYILNSRFQDSGAGSKQFMYRTFDGQLRATLAATYPTFGGQVGFENTTMLKSVLTTFEQLKAQEAKIARCNITPDNIRSRVFFKGIDTGDMGGGKLHSSYAGALWLGAIISNDETGNGGFKVGPAILRTHCQNSFHHADKDSGYFELTHTGNVLRFQKALREAMEACVEGSLELVGRLIEAEKVDVDFDALTKKAIEKFGWEQKVKGENGKTTKAIPEKYQGVLINLKTLANDTAKMDGKLAGFVNAITHAAHVKNAEGSYLFTEDEQYEMEAYATGMLYQF